MRAALRRWTYYSLIVLLVEATYYNPSARQIISAIVSIVAFIVVNEYSLPTRIDPTTSPKLPVDDILAKRLELEGASWMFDIRIKREIKDLMLPYKKAMSGVSERMAELLTFDDDDAIDDRLLRKIGAEEKRRLRVQDQDPFLHEYWPFVYIVIAAIFGLVTAEWKDIDVMDDPDVRLAYLLITLVVHLIFVTWMYMSQKALRAKKHLDKLVIDEDEEAVSIFNKLRAAKPENGSPIRDELNALLDSWHVENAPDYYNNSLEIEDYSKLNGSFF